MYSMISFSIAACRSLRAPSCSNRSKNGFSSSSARLLSEITLFTDIGASFLLASSGEAAGFLLITERMRLFLSPHTQLSVIPHYGIGSFTLGQYRSLAGSLLPTALQTSRGVALVRVAIEELRRRSVVIPRLPVLERLCAETALRAQRQLFATLSANLTDKQRRQLDALLEPHEDRQMSVFAWLRLPSGVPSPRNILIHIERL